MSSGVVTVCLDSIYELNYLTPTIPQCMPLERLMGNSLQLDLHPLALRPRMKTPQKTGRNMIQEEVHQLMVNLTEIYS